MKSIIIAILFCIAGKAYSQSGTIDGVLKDTAANKVLSLATITVFNAKDTALITYRLSNDGGKFKVPNLPLDINLRMVISFSGYAGFRKEFILTALKPILHIDTIYLQPANNLLNEVVVFAERPPVVYRQDTIEFNANAFKTLPTALLEDLLKKLPGVQVNKNGEIFVNGQRASRLMVDGKSFFGDDPKMATKNLPANIIDKVQVVDDKDAIAQNTDGDISNIGKVINITLKKAAKKGVFGKLYAGAGSLQRNEMGAIANVFKDTLQLSLLAFSNNINRSGFTLKDVQSTGGFDRSGYNSMMTTSNSNRQGFALNNISFGGTEDGLNTSSGLGFNLNHAPNKRKAFSFQYFYGQTLTNLLETENKQQFIADTNVNTSTFRNSNTASYSNTVNIGYLAKPDSLTDIDIKIGYAHTKIVQKNEITVSTINNKIGNLSNGIGDLFGKEINPWYHQDITLTRRFKNKKSRILTFYHGLSYRNNEDEKIAESVNQFLMPTSSSKTFEQLRSNKNPVLDISNYINFAEPISKKLTLRLGMRQGYINSKQTVNTFLKDANDEYNMLDNSLSTGYKRTQNRISASAGLSYKINKVTLTFGAAVLAQHIQNDFSNNTISINQRLVNILPNIRVQWKNFLLHYSMNVQAPSINYLNPVADNTNPFYIKLGNQNLLPTKRHNINGWGNIHDNKSNSDINFSLWGGVSDNDVVNASTIASNGVVTIFPVNANGTINLGNSIGFSKEYKNNQKFIFSYGISMYSSYQQRKVIVNSIESREKNLTLSPNFRITLNWNDVVEFTPSINKSFQKSIFTNNNINPININTTGSEAEIIVRWPKKIVWESNVIYTYNSSRPQGLLKTNTLWNAGVTYLFLKADKGQFKISMFDILNSNNTVNSYSYANIRNDRETNVLKRYLLATFTYNIRKLGSSRAKVGGREKMFWF
jgi:Outer membrane protein beta-barrel family